MRLYVLFALLTSSMSYAAEVTLRAPCGSDPVPAYAQSGVQPAMNVSLSKNATARIDAPCADELGTSFKAIVVLSGSFRFNGDAAQLLARLGAVSKMKGLRYWSTTDKRWTELVPTSYALEQPGSKARSDFSAAELLNGKDVFFAQSDNRSGSEVTYRMRVTSGDKDRIIAQVQNVSPVKSFGFTVYEPGDVRNVHFLKRRSADIWDYYLVTAVKKTPFGTTEASLVNRAAALYRYMAGQRADEEPPLAP
ncbi:MAG TPA: DUF6675 family protein [Burkholderiales bacterium]|nr:DUF6675 family protein [Burkholderiales bacterium]